jgi:predicted ATPase with chaperone activity
MPSSMAKTETHFAPPPSPESVAETGLRQGFLEDLTLKVLYLNGSLSLTEISAQMRLTFAVVNELLRHLRTEQMVEVTGMHGNIPQVAITTKGRNRAFELMAQNHYAGAAPVSLESYVRQVQRQSARDTDIHPPQVERAFTHLVLEQSTLDKLGTALNSGTSIFLYGPSGTGKTTIASALSHVLAEDRVFIPYAIEVDGQIIVVYDPQLHGPGDQSQNFDARWVLCPRPAVLVGGELTIEMLELQLNPVTKFYTAPAQMKANNGVLIIDDFGRQRLRPEELLNRWVVPLDRRIDFLALAGGRKIEFPFEMFVVFATNLHPATLVDAAFLRRIQTKIEIGTLADEHFHKIFRAVCKENKLEFDAAVVDELIEMIRYEFKEPLRACHPRDLVNQICWAARYSETQPVLDQHSVRTAVTAYFVAETEDVDGNRIERRN